jgi:hypothetical protein
MRALCKRTARRFPWEKLEVKTLVWTRKFTGVFFWVQVALRNAKLQCNLFSGQVDTGKAKEE